MIVPEGGRPQQPGAAAPPPELSDAILRLQLAKARAGSDPVAAAVAAGFTLLVRQLDKGAA